MTGPQRVALLAEIERMMTEDKAKLAINHWNALCWIRQRLRVRCWQQ